MPKPKAATKAEDRIEDAFSALESELDKLGKAPPERAAMKASIARLREAVGKV
jgi:hypothetical protein